MVSGPSSSEVLSSTRFVTLYSCFATEIATESKFLTAKSDRIASGYSVVR
jgi:hypothetical protein